MNDELLIVNPAKKNRYVKKRKPASRLKRRSTRKGSIRRTSRRAYMKPTKRRRIRRNPKFSFMGVDWNQALWTTAGALASRTIPQMIPMLKGYDKGFMGAGLNLGTGVVLSNFVKGKNGKAILIGSAVATAIRILNETIFKAKQMTLSGVGAVSPNDSVWDALVKQDPTLAKELDGFGDDDFDDYDDLVGLGDDIDDLDEIDFGDLAVHDDLDEFDVVEVGEIHDDEDLISEELDISGWEPDGNSDDWDN